MNVIKAVRDYVSKMVKLAPGMKVLLLDVETVIELHNYNFMEITYNYLYNIFFVWFWPPMLFVLFENKNLLF